jgi:hypothetical protein
MKLEGIRKEKVMIMRNKKENNNYRKSMLNHGIHKHQFKSWKAVAVALYITFLLLSMIPFTADRIIEPQMEGTYTYNLSYYKDGLQSHYYVERVNISEPGRIDLKYTTKTNSLMITVKNIEVLHIFCRSMYEDECKKVYGFDPYENSNYYKWYFIEKNHLNVNIDSDYTISVLKFIDTPFPVKVLVNNQQWVEDKDYFYIYNNGLALSNVPSGRTNVDIYFKSDPGGIPPTAVISASRTFAYVNQTIIFDASNSFDLDGNIIAHYFDFGNGKFGSNPLCQNSYSKAGVYGVVLTVRDNDYLVDHAYLNITVLESHSELYIRGIIPDQIMPEDSPPKILELESYEPYEYEDFEFQWYLTGEDDSLYSVTGENQTQSRLILTPLPDAYGNDLVTIWLIGPAGLVASQQLWINITPVNDPPTIYGLPDLILHYDDPYTFNYKPYVNDIETPVDDLLLSIFDGFGSDYTKINGLNITYNYPKSMVNNKIYVTVYVSDSDATVQDVLAIKITSDYVPELMKKLPDVILYEGKEELNIFDLDDYFTDPDHDVIYFSYGYSHVSIRIKSDHTVDIIAKSEWYGSEFVTFRATDPLGALAEDMIKVTVLPVNDPPIISGVPDLMVRYSYDFEFDLTTYVHDNDNPIEGLLIFTSDPDHIRVDPQNNLVIILNYPLEYLGQSIVIRLIVSDGINSSYQDINVSISENYPPELFNPLPDIVFLEDEPLINALDLNNYFMDVDGDVLFYTTGNKFINITIHDNRFVDFSAPENWHGSEMVYFRAMDPKDALKEDLIVITVLPLNDPPFILPIPEQIINEGKQTVLNLEEFIMDVDNNITELDISVNNEFVIVSGNSLVFLGSSKLPEKVELRVSDSEYNTSQMINVQLILKQQPKTTTWWDLIIDIIYFIVALILVIIIGASLIYYKNNKYIIDEIFLIHKGGLLINHLVSHSKQTNIDDVIFSGMLTAVQDYINDTCINAHENDNDKDIGSDEEICKDLDYVLDELKMGEKEILIERSENTYLAIIFSGPGSKRLRENVKKVLRKIEIEFGETLPTWDGDIRTLAGIKEILATLMNNKNKGDTLESSQKNEIRLDFHGNGDENSLESDQEESLVDIEDNIEKNSNENENLEESIEVHALDEDLEIKAPLDLDDKISVPTIKITMTNGGQEFEIDPSKSLSEQLADMEEEAENTKKNI